MGGGMSTIAAVEVDCSRQAVTNPPCGSPWGVPVKSHELQLLQVAGSNTSAPSTREDSLEGTPTRAPSDASSFPLSPGSPMSPLSPLSPLSQSSPQRPPPRPGDTMIIFDWDDTLLCTSAINASQWSQAQLEQLQGVVEALLKASMALGETLIVTNGNATWVEDSATNYFPGLLPTIQRCRVVSARAIYEQMHPGNPFAWKRRTFRDLLAPWRGPGCCAELPAAVAAGAGELAGAALAGAGVNLVVLGDSPFEMEAAESAKETLATCSLVKTVKFKEAPTVIELMGQLRKVTQDLNDIVCETSCICKGLVQRLPGEWAAESDGWGFVDSEAWHSQPLHRGVSFGSLGTGGGPLPPPQAGAGGKQEGLPLKMPEWLQQLGESLLCSHPGGAGWMCRYEDLHDFETARNDEQTLYNGYPVAAPVFVWEG